MQVANGAVEELCPRKEPGGECSLLPLRTELVKSPGKAGGGPSPLSMPATVGVSPVNRKTGILNGEKGPLERAHSYRDPHESLCQLDTAPGLAKAVMSLEHVLVELLVKGRIWVTETLSVGSNSSEHG